MNQIKIIREKLTLLGDVFVKKELLDKLLLRFELTYSIVDLTRKGLITPLKRGKYYINNLSKEYQDPYRAIDLYFGEDVYMFGGLGVYNMYGYSTQLIEWYTVYNTSFSGTRIIGKNKYIFKRQRENFFYGVTKAKSGKYTYTVMSPERAIIQMYKEGKNLHDLPRNIDTKKLLNMSRKYASKRIYNEIEKLCI